MTSVEYKTFIACTLPLGKSMAPYSTEIAADLADAGIIPSSALDRISWSEDDRVRASEVISVVAAKISARRENYHQFVDILKRYPDMSDILDLLFETFDSEWHYLECFWWALFRKCL